MRRFSYFPYLFLLFFYFCLFGMPKQMTERLRAMAVCSFSPGWQLLYAVKSSILQALTLPFSSSKAEFLHMQQKLEDLELENKLLQSHQEHIREWLLSDERVREQYDHLNKLGNTGNLDPLYKEFFKRRYKELCQRLELQVLSLRASVIFREPSSWSSALWIDVGEKQNKALGKKIVSKNSPVLFGTSIIGIVEYVGNTRSRVRLITDACVTLSVRAIRGGEQNRFLLEHCEPLLLALERREDLFSSQQEAASVFAILSHLCNKLKIQRNDQYLAKGEIFGSSFPLWRSRSPILKGIGFNYDFADEEGPSRDLRSGEPYDSHHKREPVALLRAGDMLVTTGLDGIFPAGYRIATVSKVQMLKEGASSYEIEAIATAGDLDEISRVIVLPSLEDEV